MNKKEQKYCYGNHNYIELVCGTKVEPVSCKTRASAYLRQGLPSGWKTSTKNVWRAKGRGPAGTHFMLMMAAPDGTDTQGILVARLGEWMDSHGYTLVECLGMQGDRGSVLGAVVEVEP